MRYIVILSLIFLFSCKKEEKNIQWNKISARDAFKLVDFSCDEKNTQNYFKGIMDGETFCFYEGGNILAFHGLWSGFISSEPSIGIGTGQGQPSFIELKSSLSYFNAYQWGEVPADYQAKPGDYFMTFSIKDTAFVGNSLAAFVEKFFVEGEELHLSSAYSSEDVLSTPNSQLHGASVSLQVFRDADNMSCNLYSSDMIVQPASRYVKCTKIRPYDGGYEVELDLLLDVPNAAQGFHDMVRTMKGKFHFDIKI